MKNETNKGVKYLNRYNFKIVFRYFFMSGWRSIVIWLFVLMATGTFGLTGAFIILLSAITTMILKGMYKGMWKPYNQDESNKDGSRN